MHDRRRRSRRRRTADGAALTLLHRAGDLLERSRRLLRRPGRGLLGITGPPGAGKSTLAHWLTHALDPRGTTVVRVPMDGFHLADVTLERLGRSGRKGAVDTFDAIGYLSLLQRVRSQTDDPVYAPAFDRRIEQPVAAAIEVPPAARLVVTEGNYLLLPDDPWPRIRAALDEVWFVDLDAGLRRERLEQRHVRFGKSDDRARRWVDEVDEPNAALVAAYRDRADVVVDMARLGIDAEPITT